MAILIDIPHFDLPFRFELNGHAAVVAQDEYEDVRNCVEALLHTVIGERVDLPEFGREDWVFDVQPIDLTTVMQSIAIQEPRAISQFDQEPDFLDPLVAKLTLHLDQVKDVT